jgi:hypothetical protein
MFGVLAYPLFDLVGQSFLQPAHERLCFSGGKCCVGLMVVPVTPAVPFHVPV